MALQLDTAISATIRTVLDLTSEGSAITLSHDDVNVLKGDTWVPRGDVKKQRVIFISDGKPITLEGQVPENLAIEGLCAGCRLCVEIAQRSLATRAAGQTSQTMVAMRLIGIVEVRDSKGKIVYSADTAAKPAAAVMNDRGEIKKL